VQAKGGLEGDDVGPLLARSRPLLSVPEREREREKETITVIEGDEEAGRRERGGELTGTFCTWRLCAGDEAAKRAQLDRVQAPIPPPDRLRETLSRPPIERRK
jgi:hypothetical protein